MSTDTIIKLIKYKQWADITTLRVIDEIDREKYPEKHHLMLRLMNHIYVVDMIFKANITGQQHNYTALNTPETPSIEELKTNMLKCSNWYMQHVESMNSTALNEIIKFHFVDGGEGEMKSGDMLYHVLFHGAYHRGAVGWLISECGGTPPKDVLTVFLRDHNH